MKKFITDNLTTPMFFLSAIVMLVISIFIYSMMSYTSTFLKNNIESRLIALSLLTAKITPPEILNRLQTPEDIESPLYQELKKNLISFAEDIDVLYVYYMRKSGEDGQVQFIIDNDLTEDSVGLASDPIPIEPGVESALNGKAMTAGLGNYSVGYTGLLSAFAPVFDQTGQVIAVAGVDITDEQVIMMQDRVNFMAMSLIVAMVVVLASGCLGLHLYRKQARQSEAANISKSRFLANISHEIRTPMNAIIGLSEIELEAKLSPDALANLEKIHNSGSILLGIINDILDISKMEAGAFEIIPDEFYVPTLITEVAQQNVVRIGSKNIKLILEIESSFPANLLGDSLRIRQILTNILSNAIKYTKEGQVRLKIESQNSNDQNTCVFTVTDTGVGIKPEDIGKLFSDYTQVDMKANRVIEGTGLGLSITKKLVELMHGSISVESKYGQGSSFRVTLPLKFVGSETIGGKTAAELRDFQNPKNTGRRKKDFVRTNIPPGKVLVVDDVDVNLLVAKGLLKRYGLKIDMASSGLEAIDKVRSISSEEASEKYDIIFMDHMMPSMDGIEATRIIREELGTEYAKSVPIIALTANALAGSREMFLKHGFTSFLSKPIDLVQLDLVLSTWIKKKQT